MQLLLITSGNVSEALEWLTEVDKQYNLTNKNYGIGDFIEDLKRNGYVTDDGPNGEFKMKAKAEQNLRQSALEEIFGKLKRQSLVIIKPRTAAGAMNPLQIEEITSLATHWIRFR